jgi:hypothetical protein
VSFGREAESLLSIPSVSIKIIYLFLEIFFSTAKVPMPFKIRLTLFVEYFAEADINLKP